MASFPQKKKKSRRGKRRKSKATMGQERGPERVTDLYASGDEEEFDMCRTYEFAMGEDIYGPESDLHTGPIGRGCEKNPGHKGFIPIKEFTIQHMPWYCLEKEANFAYLKCLADLVVHISASNVSTYRPAGFPLYRDRGSIEPRDGSGIVRRTFRCGQRGQALSVLADWIENLLEQYKLSELDSEKVRRTYKPLYDPAFAAVDADDGDGGGDTREKDDSTHSCLTNRFLDNIVRPIIDAWRWEILPHSRTRQFRDNFTTDLIHEIEICQTNQACKKAENDPDKFKGSDTTLNDFRKSRGMSVSEFCLALLRGLENPDLTFYDNYFSNEKFFSLLEQPCPCSECHQSGNPKKTWWMVWVKTAAHLVFDDHEADKTRVSLFFDDRSSSERVIMRGVGGYIADCPVVNARTDVNCFMCALHHDDAGQRLSSRIDQMQEGKERYLRQTTAVISHPHGRAKHISIGETLPSEEDGAGEYTASTCPGSSGGLVAGPANHYLMFFLISHSEAKGHNRNCSGYRKSLLGFYLE